MNISTKFESNWPIVVSEKKIKMQQLKTMPKTGRRHRRRESQSELIILTPVSRKTFVVHEVLI